LLWTLRTSNIAIWPEAAYRELILPRRVFGRHTLLVNDPAAIRQVLATEASSFQRFLATPRLLRPVAGNGVLLAEGDEWRRQRRMVAPAFTPGNVNLVLSHFGAAAQRLCSNAAVAGAMPVNLYRLFQNAAIDGLGRGLFSLSFADRAERLGAMARTYFRGPGRPTAADSFARHEKQFGWASWRRRAFARRWFGEIDAILDDWRAAAPSASGPSGEAKDIMTLLDRWRDPGGGASLGADELRHQAATMIAAGFETTALTMFWTAFLLAHDQRTQSAIAAELAAEPPGELGSVKDLDCWPLLRQTVFEAMRLYPPVSLMSRIAINPVRIADCDLAPGTIVVISPWVVHRHHLYWENPSAFRPDRFAGQPQAHLAGGAFMPFGGGPRTCVAATFAMSEVMILLAHLFSRFSVALDSGPAVLPQAIISTTPSVEPGFILTKRAA
jgi:cytochrome P450